jgi:hypothetical protein
VATATSTEGQTKEGTHGVPIGEVVWSGVAMTPRAEEVVLGVDESQPGVTVTPRAEATQMRPPFVPTETVAPVMEVAQPDMTAPS